MKTSNQYLDQLRGAGDRLLVGLLTILFGISLALAPWYDTWAPALGIGLPTLALCGWLTFALPGALVTRCAIAASLMLMAALQIHQSHGMIETHFAVFVLMSFLLFYRDWIPVAVASALIAAHHLLFDFLQRQGDGVWVFAANTGFHIVLVHAAYVVFEAALLTWMAIKLRAEITAVGWEPGELARLSSDIMQGRVDVEIPIEGASRHSLARAMAEMRDELQRTVRDTGGVLQAIAAGDLSKRVQVPTSGEFARLKDDVNSTVTFLNDFSLKQQKLVGEANQGNFHARCQTTALAGYQLDMANGLNELMTSFESFVDRFAEAMEALAGGDLSCPISTTYAGRLEELRRHTNRTAEQLGRIVWEIRETTQTIDRAAQDIVSGHSQLNARTEEKRRSLQETRSSVEQLASAVKSNARSAAVAEELSSEASRAAERGVAVMSQAVQTMTGVRTSSARIADISGLIEGIAFQTNLLALNAAVEAARAGEHGRGFGVVAAEVRNLSQRAAEAAKQIAQLISESVSGIDAGARLVDEMGTTMGEIVARVERTSTISKEIASASRIQSRDVDSVREAVSRIEELSQQNSKAAYDVEAAVLGMAHDAKALQRSVMVFRLPGRPAHATAVTRLPISVRRGTALGKSP